MPQTAKRRLALHRFMLQRHWQPREPQLEQRPAARHSAAAPLPARFLAHMPGRSVADIFISYKSERRKAVQHLAEIFRINGYTVWFDSGLLSGEDFSAQIEKELEAARTVITLWCRLSVTSEWVKEEAHYAKRTGKAIPVMIESVELPFGFGLSDTINLTKWDGSPRSEALDRLFQQIAQKTGKKRTPDMDAMAAFEEPWRRYGAPTLAQFALINDDAAKEAERAKSGLSRLTSRMSQPREAARATGQGKAAPASRGGLSPMLLGGAALGVVGAGAVAYLLLGKPVPVPSPLPPSTAIVAPAQPVSQTPPQTPPPTQAVARPAGILLVADDGQPGTLSRNNPLSRRVSREVGQALAASRLKPFDEASMPGFLDRAPSEPSLGDIRAALGNRAAEIDAVLLVRTYAELERIPLAPTMARPKLRVVGRLFSLAGGQSLGSVEPALGSIPPVPNNCDAPCLLDAVGTEIRIAATDIARFATEKANR